MPKMKTLVLYLNLLTSAFLAEFANFCLFMVPQFSFYGFLVLHNLLYFFFLIL